MSNFCYPYEQMLLELQSLKAVFSDKIQIQKRAVTADCRSVWEVMVGDRASGRHGLIHAGMHGREYLNCAVLMRLLRAYLSEDIFLDVCFHILPMVNPDGCTISQRGISGIRSRRLREFLEKHHEREVFSRWKANAVGVDLNRNFDSGWEAYGGAEAPGAEKYKGAAPGSEPETQAILKLCEEWPMGCCVAYHSAGSVIYWDYGSTGELYKKDKQLAGLLSKTTGYPLRSARAEKADRAGCSDYLMEALEIPSVTIETGRQETPLPESEFWQILEENRGLWKALASFLREEG